MTRGPRDRLRELLSRWSPPRGGADLAYAADARARSGRWPPWDQAALGEYAELLARALLFALCGLGLLQLLGLAAPS